MIEVQFDIQKWLREMGVAEKRITHVSQAVFKETVDLVYTNAVNWTPVGKPELWKYPASPFYEPGTLKGSWRIHWEGKIEATLMNQVPYAMRVENGWSTQAPNGMLKRAVALYPSIIQNLGEKYKL